MKKSYLLTLFILNIHLISSQVVYTDIADVIWDKTFNSWVSIDLNQDSTSEFDFTDDLFDPANLRPTVSFSSPDTHIEVFNDDIVALNSGDRIDATNGGGWIDNGIANLPATFPSFIEVYIAVQFKISTNTHYGWIRVVWDDITNALTILDFAYESIPNKAIEAGSTTSLSIPEINSFTPSVFPNPFDASISIHLNHGQTIKKLAIYSLDGKTILRNNTPLTKEINTKSLDKGIYILKLTSNEGKVFSKRIIKN